MKTNKQSLVVFLGCFCLIIRSITLKFIKELVDEVLQSTESDSDFRTRVYRNNSLWYSFRLNPFDIVVFFSGLNKAFYSLYYRGYTISKEEITWKLNRINTTTVTFK